MNDDRISFEIERFSDFEARALDIGRALDRGDDIAPQAHLSFSDMETLLSVLSAKRFSLLRLLRQIGPSSVRALAAAAGRDYKTVHGDVAALIEHGLIERQAKDRVSVQWDHLHADMRLAA
jgi:predicted transcriptional regulator